MRSLSFFNLILCIGLIVFGCTKETSLNDPNYPDTLLGHWDIEGGGSLFFEEENFSASAGCNTLFGSVNVAQETVTFSMIATTLIACPEPQRSREEELAELFESATLTYKVENNQAELQNTDGQRVLTLTRPENAELVNAWELNSIRTGNAISSSITDEDTGITFSAEGTISVQTACNSGGGSYSVKDLALALSDLAFTEMACEEERMSREEEFRQALTQINSYSILRETLTLEKDTTENITPQPKK